MKLTTKGRFAVTAMIDVALNNHEGPVTLAEVSERQKISLSYLEQLFGKLRRHGLVESVRGPGGGYNIAKPAATISVSDVILAVCKASVCNRWWTMPANERARRFMW
jgi:Rrf2 family transcriptional regulator, iron-sulfur cluster assembly transcription factor